MTIQQQNTPPSDNFDSLINDPSPLLESATPKKIAVNHPLIYLYVLFGVFIRPDKLKAYRMRLNSTEKLHLKKQASRLVSVFAWLPLLVVFVVIWSTTSIKLQSETAIVMFVFCLIAAFYTFRLEINPSPEKSNHLLLGSLFSIFGLITLLILGIYAGGKTGYPPLMLTHIALVFSLVGLCVAMVFDLRTLDIICGFIASFLVGGISMSLNQVVSNFWLPIVIIVGSVLWVGITEERHNLNVNSH